MKVLLTDDSPTMRNIQKRILSQLGITDIVEAGDGSEALKKIIENDFSFDFMLCDINMPVMSGIETLRRIKGNPKTAKMPVIMCTSVTDKEQIKRVIAAGASGYLVKPLKPEALKAKVDQIRKLKESEK